LLTRRSCLDVYLHWDHTGNPSSFPETVKLIVEPGVKEGGMPGWPTNPDGQFNEADIAGHEVVEISKGDFNITVGGTPGYDCFGVAASTSSTHPATLSDTSTH
jgi:hypothetical protein